MLVVVAASAVWLGGLVGAPGRGGQNLLWGLWGGGAVVFGGGSAVPPPPPTPDWGVNALWEPGKGGWFFLIGKKRGGGGFRGGGGGQHSPRRYKPTPATPWGRPGLWRVARSQHHQLASGSLSTAHHYPDTFSGTPPGAGVTFEQLIVVNNS